MKVAALPQVHLKPGELIISQKPSLVVTVLGSCVSVTMFHRPTRRAAICHAMLPDPKSACEDGDQASRYRYVSEVLPDMCSHFAQAGLLAEQIEVKLFGGGNVISMAEEPPSERWIGSANVRRAREILREAGYSIRASNVGGTIGRKILFNTATGEVMHKHLGYQSTKRSP